MKRLEDSVGRPCEGVLEVYQWKDHHPWPGRDIANPLIDLDLDDDPPLDEAGLPGCGDTIDAMIGGWIVEIGVLERKLNPYNKRKNCGTANVTDLEDNKEKQTTTESEPEKKIGESKKISQNSLSEVKDTTVI